MEKNSGYQHELRICKAVATLHGITALAIAVLILAVESGRLSLALPSLDERIFVITAAIASLLFLVLRYAIKSYYSLGRPQFIATWVEHLHRHKRASALALLIVLSALGELTALAAILHYLSGGRIIISLTIAALALLEIAGILLSGRLTEMLLEIDSKLQKRS